MEKIEDEENPEKIHLLLRIQEKQQIYEEENDNIQNLTFELESKIENEDLEIVGIKELSQII